MPDAEILYALTRSAARADQQASRGQQRGETTVIVIDDRRCFAELLTMTLRSVPGMRCVASATSASEGFERVRDLTPAVALLNLELSATSELAMTRRLRAVSPDTAVAVMTGSDDGVEEGRAAGAGASIRIPRSSSLAELIGALQLIASQRAADAAAPAASPRRRARTSVHRELTVRELEVLGYIQEGLPTKRIAKVMGIRVQTCYGYTKAVYAKLGVRSRIAAVNRGRQLQLL
jgi:DNA-binding NarL/FixJ family response regulator